MKIPAPPLLYYFERKSGGFLNNISLNNVTLTVILIIFLGYLVFQGIKNFQLRSMNTALQKKDSETLEKIADLGMNRRLLGDYVCDLYKLRGYYVAKETEKFENMLRHMIDFPYKNAADKKSFLENYFHTFLLKENQKYADWLLEAIRQTGDTVFIHYIEMSYKVMIEKRTDLIGELEEDINSKKYYGFALGAILVMIAKQYLYLQDKENALAYFRSAKACFDSRAVYMPMVEKNLKELEEEER